MCAATPRKQDCGRLAAVGGTVLLEQALTSTPHVLRRVEPSRSELAHPFSVEKPCLRVLAIVIKVEVQWADRFICIPFERGLQKTVRA